MTQPDGNLGPDTSLSTDQLASSAASHMWRHFADLSHGVTAPTNVIVRGEGSYIVDSEGRRYLDGLSNLFCVNIGYSFGREIAEAAAAQWERLPYLANWTSAAIPTIKLADRLAELAPGDLNHAFFTPSGGESVEAAWKMARQYFHLKGERRWKAIARQRAYHGTTLGALSLNYPALRNPFEPLVPSVGHTCNSRRLDRPNGESDADFAAHLLRDLESALLAEGPSTVAMVILEPAEAAGGMLIAPPGYYEGVRALCDTYGVLLVADETITGFGRLGSWFGSERLGIEPDILTTAKGLSSAYAVIGAVIASDRVFDTFTKARVGFGHGNTFGGHPVMAAVALKNLEIMERLNLPGRVREQETLLRATLEALYDIPVVRDVRGLGYFCGIELTDRWPDGSHMSTDELARLYSDATVTEPLAELGVLLRLYTFALHGPVISIAPPLVAEEPEFALLADALRTVLTRLSDRVGYERA